MADIGRSTVIAATFDKPSKAFDWYQGYRPDLDRLDVAGADQLIEFRSTNPSDPARLTNPDGDHRSARFKHHR